MVACGGRGFRSDGGGLWVIMCFSFFILFLMWVMVEVGGFGWWLMEVGWWLVDFGVFW